MRWRMLKDGVDPYSYCEGLEFPLRRPYYSGPINLKRICGLPFL